MDDLDKYISDRMKKDPSFTCKMEVIRLRKCIEKAIEYANHRWSEWGTRAESVLEILEAALDGKDIDDEQV